MIGYISGTIIHQSPTGRDITVLTPGGVGYRIQVGSPIEYPIDSTVQMFITTVVREDALDLYGFDSADERELFEVLTSVSGVGPRIASGILATTTPGTLAGAIANKDIAFLTTLSGIGKKTAEKICIEIAEKMKKLSFETTTSTAHNDLMDALVSMGYQSRDIIALLQNHTFTDTTLQGKIRTALSLLQQARK